MNAAPSIVLRLALAGALACAAGMWPPPAAGAGPAALEALRLPAGSRREPLADAMWLHGMPARVQVFDAPLGVSDLVRFLSDQQPALADLRVLPGQAILSGRIGHEQWIVQMEGLGPRRTVGSISAADTRAVAGPPSPQWLPAGGRLRLDIAVRDGGVLVTERIWQYGEPPARLARRVAQGLKRAGWRPLPAAGAPQWWTKGAARLRISLAPLAAGSGLLASGWTP